MVSQARVMRKSPRSIRARNMFREESGKRVGRACVEDWPLEHIDPAMATQISKLLVSGHSGGNNLK